MDITNSLIILLLIAAATAYGIFVGRAKGARFAGPDVRAILDFDTRTLYMRVQ